MEAFSTSLVFTREAELFQRSMPSVFFFVFFFTALGGLV